MAGYSSRQETYVDTDTILSADTNNEFDTILAAFSSSTGHAHDGTAGEGPGLLALGPGQDVTISATVLGVKTDDTVSLGTASLQFKNAFFDGTLTADDIVLGAGVLDLNGGKLVLDSNANTSIHASTDDQIDFEISGADDFVMIANIFRALSGSVLETDTINETTSAAGVTIDSVVIKDGGITLTTDLTVANGGTGASTFTDGGVLLGSGTGPITATAVLADGEFIVGDGTTDPVLESGNTARTSLGLGTGDSPTFAGLTLTADLTVANGGTGASTFTDGGVLLGSGTGAITAMGVLSDSEMIVGDGTTDPVAESGATLRTSIGVGTGDSPQFTAVNVGAATDTTLARVSAGVLSVEGNTIYHQSGTDVIVADGGTGASTLTDGGILLGSGTGAITATAVLADGEFVVGDGTTDPVLESGNTARTSLGIANHDSIVVSAAGEAINAEQPAFLATASAQANVTGDATVYTLIFDTEIYDQNADFDGTSTFTAPVTGIYHFDVFVRLSGITSAEDEGEVIAVASNRSLVLQRTVTGGSGDDSLRGSVDVDMDAADTITFTLTVFGGTKIVDVATQSYLSGHLVT